MFEDATGKPRIQSTRQKLKIEIKKNSRKAVLGRFVHKHGFFSQQQFPFNFHRACTGEKRHYCSK
jgi:hypothetical protein